MERERIKKRSKVTPVRRTFQFLVLITIIGVPLFSQNFYDWTPSSLVMGELPPPSVSPVSGDTYCFSIGDVFICHPVAFLESALSSRRLYVPLLAAALIPLVITILCGRVFCSWLCPMGLSFEFLTKISKKAGLVTGVRTRLARDFRYAILCVLLALCFLSGLTWISLFDPPHVMGRELMYLFTHHRVSMGGTGLLTIVLLLDLFVSRRVWCRSVCPSGGCLSLLGMKRLLRIGLDREKCVRCGTCSEVCPFGLDPGSLINNHNNFNWAICGNCGKCIDGCPGGAISYYMWPLYGRKQI